MINNIRDTGCPRMDILDDAMFKAEKGLSNFSCYVVTAPLAGPAKIIMGIFQTIIASVVAVVLLPTNYSLLKERWITHIQNGLGNILRGFLETIPFVGLGIACDESLRESPVSTIAFDRPEYQGMFSKIQYPSIKLRKWKIVHHFEISGGKEDRNATKYLEKKISEKMLNQNSQLSLKERNKIIDKVFLENLDSERDFVVVPPSECNPDDNLVDPNITPTRPEDGRLPKKIIVYKSANMGSTSIPLNEMI